MAMGFEALPERLAQVRAELARRAADPGTVTIVAVTKGFGTDAVRAAIGAGIADIGENRVQEAVQKQDELGAGGKGLGIRWPLSGLLQRNEAGVVVGRFDIVHSLDSLELATELNRRLQAPLRVLLQVNVAGESHKSGCAPDETPALARQVTALEHLRLEGLMTMAPLTDDEDAQRRTFRGLRVLRDRIKEEEGLWLPTLSMGMSGDYASAAQEGATVIRLGTVLFGPRT